MDFTKSQDGILGWKDLKAHPVPPHTRGTWLFPWADNDEEKGEVFKLKEERFGYLE